MKISDLISKLQTARDLYGECNVAFNELSGDRMFIHNICIEDNQDYIEEGDEENRYELLLEGAIETPDSDKVYCYEYPSNKTIEL